MIFFNKINSIPVNNAFLLEKGFNFPRCHVWLFVCKCRYMLSKPFRGAVVMDGLLGIEEHKLIGCGGYHIVHWRHGFCSYISSKELPLKICSHAYTHLSFLIFLMFNVLCVVLFLQIGILIAPRK